MKFSYQGTDDQKQPVEGTLEAPSKMEALVSLQNQNIHINSIVEKKGLGNIEFNFFNKVSPKEVVLISRQISTLFTAQVSVIKVFTMLAKETETPEMGRVMTEVVKQLESGSTLAAAMTRYQKVFSPFYVSMVAAGEETGKLSLTFEYLADYLERSYELTSKAKNALVYPAFVIGTFVAVMVLMLTFIIPKIGIILIDSGQELPAYTKLVLGASSFLVSYGFLLLALIIILVFGIMYYLRTETGKRHFSEVALRTPYVGELYQKLYLSRFADNMDTMLSSGIAMVRALETTKEVIGNRTYSAILTEVTNDVRAGKPLSQSLRQYSEFIPPIMTQMVAVGEESGNIGNILKTLSNFYKKEVTSAVDTLVGLIEPAMIVLLGIGVGTLLASVLIPIYNVSTAV